MQTHDEMEGGQRRRAAKAPQSAEAADVGHAIADPKTASVQAMLEVQRLAGNAGVNQLLARDEDGDAAKSAPRSPVLDVVGQGGGQPLETGLRREMEGRLGADFGDVRLHTDAKATGSARAVQANAYTVGNDVVVRNDRWSPTSDRGKETLAHELTHVVQQRAGPVAGTSTGDGISVSSPDDQFERAAESRAARAMAARASTTSPGASAAGGVSAQLDGDQVERLVAQRDAAPEDEETEEAGAPAQREAAPEDEETDEAAAPTQREAAPEDEETEEAAAPTQREAALGDDTLESP